MTVPARDLFISHSSGDAESAQALRELLEAAGYSCWMAPDDVIGTDPWAGQILEAIEASKAMIVLLSGHTNKSGHVSREVNLAVSRGRPILPIRLENVAPSAALEYFLSDAQRLDAFSAPLAGHRERILRRVAAMTPPSGAATANTPGPTLTVAPVEVARATGAGAGAPQRPALLARFRPTWGFSGSLVTLLLLAILGTGVLVIGPSLATSTPTPGPLTAASSDASSAGTSPAPQPSPTYPIFVIPTHSFAPLASPGSTSTASARPPTPTPTKTPKPTVKPTTVPTAVPPTAAPAYNPARLTGISNGATIHGSTFGFSWSAATGPQPARFYAIYIGSTPPGDPCPSTTWCAEPAHDSFSPTDIDKGLGLEPTDHNFDASNLPAKGDTIYVRLLTKFEPESGILSWRDYTFTSAP